MGLISFNPATIFTSLHDDALEQQAAKLAISVAYSQYITLLDSLGDSIAKNWLLGFLSPVFKMMAASCLKQLQTQDIEKVLALSYPKTMITNPLGDSIQCEERKQK